MPTQRNDFTTFDIIKALGIPRERLQDWINRGFIKPSIPAEGKGSKAIFTRNDVYKVEIFRQLVKFSLNRKDASYISDSIISYKKDPESGKVVGEFKPHACSVFFNDNEIFGLENIKHTPKSMSSNFPHTFSLRFYLPDTEDKDMFQGPILKPILEGKSKEDWDQILTLNFEKIRKKVDMALSGLG